MGLRRADRRTIGLPPGMHFKGGSYYYVGNYDPVTGKRPWIKLGKTLRGAQIAYRSITEFYANLPRFSDFKDHFAYLRQKAKMGARSRGLECSLTVQDVEEMWRRSMGLCEVTGIPFEYSFSEPFQRSSPWAPSIDRIDCEQGYHPENVRLVCLAANLAMNQWGEEVLVRLAEFVRRKRG